MMRSCTVTKAVFVSTVRAETPTAMGQFCKFSDEVTERRRSLMMGEGRRSDGIDEKPVERSR